MRFEIMRHGMTRGNKEKRYIGITDEDLCEEGIDKLFTLKKIHDLKEEKIDPEIIFTSPLKRCIQSAQIFYPDIMKITVDEFRETDFGVFEGKNYVELMHNKAYSDWLSANCQSKIPQGEAFSEVKKRIISGWEKSISYMEKHHIQAAAFVVHGGTIMHLLHHYEKEHGSFYDRQVQNGQGFFCRWNVQKEKIEIEGEWK